MILLREIIFLLLAYVLGSIPVGYILTSHYFGLNILELGSGNIGSTNVRRTTNNALGLVTQLLDMLKGLLPIALFLMFKPLVSIPHFILFLALAAILGHDFSLFLRFKGGKGVNTTLGATVLLAPYSVFIAVGLYFVVKWKFRYVSLGSIVIAFTLPLIQWILYGFSPLFYYLLSCSCLIILMHRANIVRLINGSELKS